LEDFIMGDYKTAYFKHDDWAEKQEENDPIAADVRSATWDGQRGVYVVNYYDRSATELLLHNAVTGAADSDPIRVTHWPQARVQAVGTTGGGAWSANLVTYRRSARFSPRAELKSGDLTNGVSTTVMYVEQEDLPNVVAGDFASGRVDLYLKNTRVIAESRTIDANGAVSATISGTDYWKFTATVAFSQSVGSYTINSSTNPSDKIRLVEGAWFIADTTAMDQTAALYRAVINIDCSGEDEIYVAIETKVGAEPVTVRIGGGV
jgi:hypothetical protein